jgi:hypothetical protein
LLAAAAPKIHLTTGQRVFQGFGIHPGDHEHLSGSCILADNGDQTALIKPEITQFYFHSGTLSQVNVGNGARP